MQTHISSNGRKIHVGQRYRHFKGGEYVVLAVAVHSETQEPLVIYQRADQAATCARPLEMFLSLVDVQKYPEATQKYRFECISESEQIDSEEPSTSSNAVNHPSHYQGKRECIEVMRKMFGDDAVRGFCKCNSFKYRFRSGAKEGNPTEQDIAKAEWYEEYLFKMDNEYTEKENLK